MSLVQLKGNRSGFTMVEIIAVLVIIGILVAVAAPKFVNMADDARDKAAMAGVSECKASLSVAFSKAYLASDGVQPTRAQVLTAAGLAVGDVTFGDVVVTLANNANGTDVDITTKSVKGTVVATPTTDTWVLPTIS